MADTNDWYDWHRPYADPLSSLSRRLRLVQHHIGAWLDSREDATLTMVSICAGQGRDILTVLADRPHDAARLRCRLLEYDQRNVAEAEATARAAGLSNVSVLRADAGDLASYAGAVPADLVLLAGVFGNITDADIRTTIDALPRLCAADATVIWTRTRSAPDRTPAVRSWFEAAGFTECAFHAPADVLFGVGVHRFHGHPQPWQPEGRLFRFVR